MVTKRQINKLKQKLRPRIQEIEEVEIYLISEDGTIETPDGQTITKSEYNKRLKEERETGEKIVEINIKGAV